MKKFFKSSKDDKAKALCTSLIEETKHLAKIYKKNLSNISELSRSSFEQGIQGYGIDTEIIKFENQLNDKSFENFKFTYALIRSLYSYMESILIEIDIPELNKKEFENIVNPNLPSLEEIISIDKAVGFHYKDEYDDPIHNYLYVVDEEGEYDLERKLGRDELIRVLTNPINEKALEDDPKVSKELEAIVWEHINFSELEEE